MSKHVVEVKFQLILSGDGEIDLKVGSVRIDAYEGVEGDPRFGGQDGKGVSRGVGAAVVSTSSFGTNIPGLHRALETNINLPRECLRLLALHFAPSGEDGETGMGGEGGGG